MLLNRSVESALQDDCFAQSKAELALIKLDRKEHWIVRADNLIEKFQTLVSYLRAILYRDVG